MVAIPAVSVGILRVIIERMYFRSTKHQSLWVCVLCLNPIVEALEYEFYVLKNTRSMLVASPSRCVEILPEHFGLISESSKLINWIFMLFEPIASPSLTMAEIRILNRAGIALRLSNL